MLQHAHMAILTIDAATEPPAPALPAVLLVNPKFSANVAKIYRLAACFGVAQIWQTGNRIGPEFGRRRRTRLPPEERLRGHGKVDLLKWSRGTDAELFAHLRVSGAKLVGVEMDARSESLVGFEHQPSDAGGIVYVFGPEDDRLGDAELDACDVVVQIPAFHCLNLAMAVTAMLWDRTSQLAREHAVPPPRLVEV